MKHKVKITVETKKKGFFGTKTVREEKTVWVDSKTYKQIQKEHRSRPYTVEEMMLYDWIFDDGDYE